VIGTLTAVSAVTMAGYVDLYADKRCRIAKVDDNDDNGVTSAQR
jgi:hypothetical protein